MKWLSILCLFGLTAGACAQPFPIGHRTITYVDSTRGNRNVSSEVYYPATIAGENTPVAVPSQGGFPVISFGHGFLLPTSAYQYLWNGIVPEGFIFVLPNTESGFSPSHLQFGLDLAFLTRVFQRENQDEASPFFGKIALSNCVMGHSMGGGASFLAAASDTSISAVVTLAAAETTPSAISAAAQIHVPALVFAASGDCVTPPEAHQIPMYEALPSECKTYINATGGSHCKFGENNFTCNLGELTCSGSISRSTQHQIVLSHLLPFLKFYLQGIHEANCEFQTGLQAGNGITWMRDCALLPAPILTIAHVEDGVRLSWSAVADACGYELLQGSDEEFDYNSDLIIYAGLERMYIDSPQEAQAVYRVWAK